MPLYLIAIITVFVTATLAIINTKDSITQVWIVLCLIYMIQGIQVLIFTAKQQIPDIKETKESKESKEKKAIHMMIKNLKGFPYLYDINMVEGFLQVTVYSVPQQRERGIFDIVYQAGEDVFEKYEIPIQPLILNGEKT